jgi:hypothetical protein
MWLDNLVDAYKPAHVAPAAAPLVNDVIAPLANATLKATLGLAGQPILQPDVPLVTTLERMFAPTMRTMTLFAALSCAILQNLVAGRRFVLQTSPAVLGRL